MAAPQQPGFFGQYAGYSPRAGGGYDFQLANGQTVPIPPGQQAEELKKNIDAATKAAGGAVYQPGAGPMAPPPNQPQPAAPAPARFQPTATVKGGGTLGVREGGDPNNPLDYVVREAPRAATKGGLALRTQSQQGGYELDPERVQAVEESQRRIMAAREEGAQKMAELSAERAAAAAEERAQLQREAAVVQHEQSVKEQQVAELRAKHEAAQKDFLETPERQRQAREGNTGRNIIEGIALALGSLGAGLARTPNFAMQTIESIHEREMRAEEAALRVKKEGADSLLGRLKDEMGSVDQAKLSYRAIRSRDAALRLESLAQRSSDEQQRSALLAAAEQENQQHLKWLEALERGAQGEVTKNFQMVQGSAGSRGGNRAPTIEELKGMAELRKTQAETGKTEREGVAGGNLSDTAANTLSNIDASLGLLPGLAESSRKAGRIFAPETEVAGFSLSSDETNEYKAKARNVVRVATKAIEGDSAAESHVAAQEAGLLSGDPAKREAAQVEIARVLQAKRRAMEGVVPGAQTK